MQTDPVDHDLERLLAERFGWSRVQVKSHDGGMNSRTWWVQGDDGRCIAKWVPRSEVRLLEAGVLAADLAAATGIATGRALTAREGDRVLPWQGGSVAVLSVVPGVELSGGTSADMRDIGTTLARVHGATVLGRVEGAWTWHWVAPDAETLGIDPDVRDAVADAVARVAAIPDRLTVGVAHGDPAPEAFVRSGDGVGLIDWASCVNGPLMYDVASATMYLGGPTSAYQFLEAYVAAGGPVPEVEAREHLETFLRFRWAVQADYFARRLAAGDHTGISSDAGNHQGFADARHRLLGWY